MHTISSLSMHMVLEHHIALLIHCNILFPCHKEEHGACLHENDHHDTVCRKAMPMEATSSTALVAVVKKCCCSYTGCESEGNDDSYFGGNRCGDIRKEYLRFQEFDAMHIKKESESALASDPFPCSMLFIIKRCISLRSFDLECDAVLSIIYIIIDNVVADVVQNKFNDLMEEIKLK